ncbi:MAG: nickel pincer cofactor biosynthesis protein LarB [Anaerofustis stercorihominis]|nr:nickel pincer cofactor biosynthesis protein LarB [Anaerofustis stercorihominis]
MDKEYILRLLESVKNGETDIDSAACELIYEPYSDIDYAKIDNSRKLIQSVGEVIYGESKTSEQIIGIVSKMKEKDDSEILITRLSEEKADEVMKHFAMRYDINARIGVIAGEKPVHTGKEVLLLCAGTSDLAVAEEAAMTLEFLGHSPKRIYDVGVAGLHRLLSHIDEIGSAEVIIVIAGMEGALASVVGGLSSAPVIAVPTSVGYGANFGGLSALLSMLNSCASGVGVVNIDNGFGAAMLANRIIGRK